MRCCKCRGGIFPEPFCEPTTEASLRTTLQLSVILSGCCSVGGGVRWGGVGGEGGRQRWEAQAYSVATYLYIFEYNLVSGTTFAHQYNQGTYEMMFVFVLWNLFSKYITCETLNFHRIKF